MSLKLLPLLAMCLAVCLPVHSANMSVQQSGAAVLNAAPAAGNRGALYRVSHEGRTAYLFGTIHVGKQGALPLAPQAARALLASKALVIELDIRQNEPFQLALARHGSYAEGDTIQHHLSPASLQLLVQALSRAGLSLQSVERYKPWLLANMLVGQELDRNGFQRADAVEYVLLAAAQKQDKTVRELESAEYQLALFDSLDEHQQEQYLLENLADLADGNSLRKSEELIEAWNSADGGRINAAWRTLTSGDTVSAGFMQRTLLGKRNPEMASSIERILQQDQVAFVGVGLLHLVGDNGLPQLLRQRGYEVEQVF
jgi:uncharacterized protein YbaP (TraB family)